MVVDMSSRFHTSVLGGGRDTIKAFVGLLEHVRRTMERDDHMTLKSQEGGMEEGKEDNVLEELMEALHSCVQDLLQTAHSSSKSKALPFLHLTQQMFICTCITIKPT